MTLFGGMMTKTAGETQGQQNRKLSVIPATTFKRQILPGKNIFQDRMNLRICLYQ